MAWSRPGRMQQVGSGPRSQCGGGGGAGGVPAERPRPHEPEQDTQPWPGVVPPTGQGLQGKERPVGWVCVQPSLPAHTQPDSQGLSCVS